MRIYWPFVIPRLAHNGLVGGSSPPGPTTQDNPLSPMHGRMRAIDRDLIREGHYGQRSCEPRKQAEHMAAPTNAAYVQESPCQLGAVHTWGFSGQRVGHR